MNFVTNILKKYIQSETEQPAALIPIPTEPENKENGFGMVHDKTSQEYLSASSSIISSATKSEEIRTRRSVLTEFDPLLQSSFSGPIKDLSILETEESTEKRIDQTLLVSIEGGDINDKKNVPEKSPEYYSACESSPVKSVESEILLTQTEKVLKQVGEEVVNFPVALVPEVAPVEVKVEISEVGGVGDTSVATVQEIPVTQSPKEEQKAKLEYKVAPVEVKVEISEVGGVGDPSVATVQEIPVTESPKEKQKSKLEYKGVLIEDPLEFIRRSIETNVSGTVASPRFFKNQESFEAIKRSLSPIPLFPNQPYPTSTSPEPGVKLSQSAPELSPRPEKINVSPRIQLLRNTIDPADIPTLPKTSSLLVNASSDSEIYTGGELEGSKSETEFLGRDLRLREIVSSNISIRSEERERLEKLQNQAVSVPLPDDEDDDIIPPPAIFPPGQAYVFTFATNRRKVEKISLDDLDQQTLTQLHLQRLVHQIEIEEKLANPTIQQNLIDSYKIKIMDYSDEIIRLQGELSELKLQLNASQQHKASLELEIRQKEEIIIKCQAETLKVEQAYKLEIKQLQEQLKENSKLIEKDSVKELEDQLKQAKDAEAKAVAELSQRQKDENNYATVFADFENTLARRAEEYATMLEEHETVKKHLSNMEIAFSDVHSKYEKSKELLLSMKQNEDALITTLAEYQQTNIAHEEKYESLKAHAKGQIEKSNREILALRQNQETEVAKLKAIIKRQDIKCSALEVTLQQKTAECEQLAALCDEVTGKKV